MNGYVFNFDLKVGLLSSSEDLAIRQRKSQIVGPETDFYHDKLKLGKFQLIIGYAVGLFICQIAKFRLMVIYFLTKPRNP